MTYASIALLAYKRPSQLKKCMESLLHSLDYPCEIIVHLDGDDSGNAEYLFDMYKKKKISWLIMNGGLNGGVGRSLTRARRLATGKYFVKCDTDLEFEKGWLSNGVSILENNPSVSCVSFFNYNNYDPNDKRFFTTKNLPMCYVVSDIVSSIYLCETEKLPMTIPDDGIHTQLGGDMAITKRDYVINTGFGVGRSVYVTGTPENPVVSPVHDTPLLFEFGRNP